MAEKKIVTLVDASVYAESVCDHASWAAQRLEAPVELLHVIGRRQTGRQDVSGALALGARTRMLEELTKLEGEKKISNTAQKQMDKWMALAKSGAK